MAARIRLFNNGLVQPSLVDDIKAILETYPDDDQILKELVQNADDAKATEVNFIWDETQYGTATLIDPALAEFQVSSEKL